MAIGLELTDDEMARVMECRERWSDDEAIERAAGICVSEMVRTFEMLAARAGRDIVRKKRIDQGRQYRGDRRANEKR